MNAPAVKHPRRLGFATFNIAALVVAAALVAFLVSNSGNVEVAEVPNAVLASTALGVLALVWAGSWIAWGLMVWSRRRRTGL